MSHEHFDPNNVETSHLASTAPVAPDGHLDLSPGTILLDRYKVIGLLGRGGMGSVYCVEHLHLEKQYALKFLHKHQANDASWRRFETEARAANKLDHPNLVKVHDSGLLADGQPYFIMDLVEGESLSDALKKNGRLPIEQALKIFIQVGFALSYAHSNGVIHRDIKPSNIMISSADVGDAQGVLVKVVDFGIAKLTGKDEFNQQTLTKTGEIFGSPLYMSPEQCLGIAIDQRCDLYSLGCVIFESLTGAPPLVGDNALSTMMKHQSETPFSLKEASMGIEFPEKMEAIVARLLEKDPEQRYQSAQHLTADLVGLDSGQVSMFEAMPAPKLQLQQDSKTYNNFLLLFYAACIFFVGASIGLISPRIKEKKAAVSFTKSLLSGKKDLVREISRAKIKEKDAENEKIEALEKTKGYFSKPGKERGERVFEFPEFAVGDIVFSKRNMPPAKGLMRFPKFTGLIFAPSEQFQKHPKLFQKFRADDIDSLDLQSRAHFMNMREKDMSAASSALYGIGHLTRIRSVDLGDTVLTPEALLQLNKLPNLQKLLLTRINLSGSDVAKLNCLEHLIFLKMVKVQHIKPVVERIRKSKVIDQLVLNSCNVDNEDVKKIGEIKQLSILDIANNKKVTDESIAFLPPNLTELELRRCSITSKCAKHLIRIKSLKRLTLSQSGWSDVEIAILKAQIPGAKFFDGNIEL